MENGLVIAKQEGEGVGRTGSLGLVDENCCIQKGQTTVQGTVSSLLGQTTMEKNIYKKELGGVPIMAQQLMNPTSICEDAGPIPGLAQWVKDPAL